MKKLNFLGLLCLSLCMMPAVADDWASIDSIDGFFSVKLPCRVDVKTIKTDENKTQRAYSCKAGQTSYEIGETVFTEKGSDSKALHSRDVLKTLEKTMIASYKKDFGETAKINTKRTVSGKYRVLEIDINGTGKTAGPVTVRAIVYDGPQAFIQLSSGGPSTELDTVKKAFDSLKMTK